MKRLTQIVKQLGYLLALVALCLNFLLFIPYHIILTIWIISLVLTCLSYKTSKPANPLITIVIFLTALAFLIDLNLVQYTSPLMALALTIAFWGSLFSIILAGLLYLSLQKSHTTNHG